MQNQSPGVLHPSIRRNTQHGICYVDGVCLSQTPLWSSTKERNEEYVEFWESQEEFHENSLLHIKFRQSSRAEYIQVDY
jgi:hypothetical protein